jgi:hypothetical protein
VTEEAREQGAGREFSKMSRRTAAWFAWSLWLLCAALLAFTMLLDYYYTPPFPNRGTSSAYEFFAVPLLVYVTVGALVASRRPKNLVGWMLCAISFVFAAHGFAVAYTDYALLAQPGSSLPGAVYMACFSQSLIALPMLMLPATLLVLLFPDGRLPDRSLRAVPWAVVGGSATASLWAATADKEFERYSLLNPLWVGGAFGDALDALGRLGAAALFVSFVIGVIAVFARLRSAGGVERQQIKWFAYAAAVLLASFYFGLPFSWLLPSWASFPLGVAGLSAIPVAVGIAVLRYRLYDVDVIINRTLVYGALTALLALVYFGGVATTQTILRALTNQEEQPQLAIVVSTLVIAALFMPLRRRIQSFIDRRFYRRKYDAAKTLEAFSAKLRDETDLDALSDDLVAVVKETMQPAHVSLWLLPNRGAKRGDSTSVEPRD